MNLLVIVPAERKIIVPAIQGTNFLNMPGSLRPAVRSSIASMMSAIQARPVTQGLARNSRIMAILVDTPNSSDCAAANDVQISANKNTQKALRRLF